MENNDEKKPAVDTLPAEVLDAIPENISSDADYIQQEEPFYADNTEGEKPFVFNPEDEHHREAVTNVAAQEVFKIQKLVKAGAIDPIQGQNLMNHVVFKAYEMITQNGSGDNSTFEENDAGDIASAFFKGEGREEFLNFIKRSNIAVNKDEISQMADMVEKIENSAIKRYLGKLRHEKTVNDENEAAKRKLRVNAQKQGSGKNMTTVFTRDQIGKMSGAEFAKYERAIMDQLKKGLIQ